MELIEEDFLKFVTKCNAVKFGQFQLKDGSSSDIFFNSAAFDTGLKIKSLARFFAHKIQALSPNCKLVYGSAYKGIPLATAVAMELSHITGDEIGYLFNRKEEKSHGDGGIFVGKLPKKDDVVVFVDDVVTSGKTKEDGIVALKETFDIKIQDIFVAVDRRQSPGSIQECAVHSLITLNRLREFLQKKKKNVH